MSYPSNQDKIREVLQARFRAQYLRESVLIDEEQVDPEDMTIRDRKILREPKALTVPAACAGERRIRWFVDRGCPIDLVGLNDLNDTERNLVKRSGHEHSLCTANGTTGTQGRIDGSCKRLKARVQAHVLPNTPALISVGKRCMEMGYSFRWEAGQSPFLDDPEVRCVSIDGCAFGMTDGKGNPIKKQWRIATTSPELAVELQRYLRRHSKGFKHSRIEGALTPKIRWKANEGSPD